jgi:hypothetical protein
MSGPQRLLLAGLAAALLTPGARAQRVFYPPYPAYPNQYALASLAARQAAYNTAVLGQALAQAPPWVYGYNPYVGSVYVAPAVVPTYAVSPYALGAYGGYYPYYYGYGGPGLAGPGIGYGMALQGLASYTQSAGQYWKDIQQARILREQSRQAAIDTQRKRLEWEMEYEKLRPTAPKMMAAERAADLDWARMDPPSTEIWSGRALNTLLRSIFASPAPTRGPNISLEPDTVRGLNLTDGAARGSLALAKNGGQIAWTEALQESAFDGLRERFARNFARAIQDVSAGEALSRAQLGELRSDLKGLQEKLDDMIRDLPPSRWIESRRLLNKLGDAVTGLANPRLCKACGRDWRKGVHTVADLVSYCLKNGLEFGPAAAAGDEPCYTAAYYALRAYERGLAGTRTLSTSN